MSLSGDLASLVTRELTTLLREIEAFPTDAMLWESVPGITNPAGNLVLHLEGNLREYIGRQLGGLPFSRNRPLEFSARGLGRRELMERITAVRDTIPAVLRSLSREQMESQYPEVVLERPMSTEAFLVHLLGHLNWHLGQIDSLRRTLSGSGAIQRAAL